MGNLASTSPACPSSSRPGSRARWRWCKTADHRRARWPLRQWWAACSLDCWPRRLQEHDSAQGEREDSICSMLHCVLSCHAFFPVEEPALKPSKTQWLLPLRTAHPSAQRRGVGVCPPGASPLAGEPKVRATGRRPGSQLPNREAWSSPEENPERTPAWGWALHNAAGTDSRRSGDRSHVAMAECS